MRFGCVWAVLGVPLEYLALLRMAAEGAAGLSKIKGDGTVLVYGASRANGFAAVQLAASTGKHTVVGVVDGQHSCSADMIEYVKGMIPEPGTAVSQEYSIAKKNFSDLVDGISSGDEGLASYTAAECLDEFKKNLSDHSICSLWRNIFAQRSTFETRLRMNDLQLKAS